MTWYQQTDKGIIISLHIVPRSSKNKIDGLHGDALKIRLQAPPVDGKANKKLIKFLAKTLQVPPSSLTIISGETSRKKRIHINGAKPADITQLLP